MDIKNTDISKIKTNNKIYNISFLMKKNVFKRLCLYTNSITDTSFAYIPYADYERTFTDSNGNKMYVNFSSPNEENNYADLSFIINKDIYNVKACRIKTFDCISMDGSLLTYAKNTISDKNLFVFYSINPNEADHILMMSAKVYNMFTEMNYDEHFLHFNAKYCDKLRNVFKLDENELCYVNYNDEIEIDESCETNINIKRNYCLTTLNLIKRKSEESKLKMNNKRTHFGKQYSAINITNGNIRQFRDVRARNKFFESINCKLACDRSVAENCENMNKIVMNEKIENYRTNIMKNGWIICDYISDLSKLTEFINTLIIKVCEKSKRLCSRIEQIKKSAEKNIFLIINTIKHKTNEMREKVKNKLSYFRPLNLFESVIYNNEWNKESYYQKHPYMKKLF